MESLAAPATAAPRPPRPPPPPGPGGLDILDAAATAARLPYAALADAIRGVALARHPDTVQAPPRLALPLPNRSVLLVMPASDGELAITKLVTVHPENPGRGRAAIAGRGGRA